jgi:hypothetical protein
MADLRDAALLNQMKAGASRVAPQVNLGVRFKLAIRRFVVASSATPLCSFYNAIYRWHLAYAVRRLRRLTGVHSIYVTRGMALSEVLPGISDIDLNIYGEWNNLQEAAVNSELDRLMRLSPLFDAQPAQSIESLQSLYATDYSFQLSLHQGRTEWRLMYGEGVFDLLPDMPISRVAGAYYMELRVWWGRFVNSAFGFGEMAIDELFRTSTAYKVVANLMNFQSVLEGGPPESSRSRMMQSALSRMAGEDRRLLQRLVASADSRHRSFDGNIQEETFPFLLRNYEEVHAKLRGTPSFQSIAAQIHIDASASEMLVSSSARAHAETMVEWVKKNWTGFRAAYLVPSLSFYYPDDLVLLLEVDPADLPTVAQIRQLCRYSIDGGSRLIQRVAPYLLLAGGAYELEILSEVELWHHTFHPLANPEIFALIERREFVLHGAPRGPSEPPVWTRFGSDLIDEELMIRRAALSKIAEAGNIASLELLRNLWRHLQLEIVQRSAAGGSVLLPMTPAAVQRALQMFGFPGGALLEQLRVAYESEINGEPVDVSPLLPGLMQMFGAL